MKALILYFSGTGNTEYVSNKIRNLLIEFEVETEIHSIEEKFSIKANTFDMLILGCPKYYEYLVLDFIKYLKINLPVNDKKIPTMIFCTQVGPLKTNFNKIEKLLKQKNYILTASRSFPIANNMVIYDIFPLTTDEKLQINISNLNIQLKSMVDDFINDKMNIEKTNLFYREITYISGILSTKLFSLFRVKYSTSIECTGCGLCAKKCPKQNIKMHNNKPEFGRECMLCMRCINICPSNAILYKNKQRKQYKKLESIYFTN